MTLKGASDFNGTLNGLDPGLIALRLGPRRSRILHILDENPGLNLDEVANALSVRRTAAKHHLRLLERDRLVIRVRQGRHVLHFRQGLPLVDQEVFRLLRVPSVRRVAEAFFVDGTRAGEELAAALDLTPRTVRRAVKQLKRSGLARVEDGPAGRHIALHPRMRVLLARRIGSGTMAPLPSPEDAS